MSLFSKEEIKSMSQDVAIQMGKVLNQRYELVGNTWWLISLGQRVRRLTNREVEWHVKRKHAPFVTNGITPDHADYWKDMK